MAMSRTESIGSPPESTTLITPSATQNAIEEEETSGSNEDLSVSSTSAAIVNDEGSLDSSNLSMSQKENETCEEPSVPLPLSKISLDKVDFIRVIFYYKYFKHFTTFLTYRVLITELSSMFYAIKEFGMIEAQAM